MITPDQIHGNDKKMNKSAGGLYSVEDAQEARVEPKKTLTTRGPAGLHVACGIDILSVAADQTS